MLARMFFAAISHRTIISLLVLHNDNSNMIDDNNINDNVNRNNQTESDNKTKAKYLL